MRRERINRSIERMKDKVRKINEERKAVEKKRAILESIIRRDTKRLLTPTALQFRSELRFISEEKLEVLLEKRLLHRKEKKAATVIQTAFRRYRCLCIFKSVVENRLKAALKI